MKTDAELCALKAAFHIDGPTRACYCNARLKDADIIKYHLGLTSVMFDVKASAHRSQCPYSKAIAHLKLSFPEWQST
jgi:hypothetical protein